LGIMVHVSKRNENELQGPARRSIQISNEEAPNPAFPDNRKLERC